LVTVVARPLVGIAKNLIGLGDGTEAVRGAVVVAEVGVVLAREAPVGAADLGSAGVLEYAEETVVVAAKIDGSGLGQHCVLSRCRREPSTRAGSVELAGHITYGGDAHGPRMAPAGT
jgi:hypothetical protein